MKKVMLLFSFLFCVTSYSSTPSYSVCDDYTEVSVEKENVLTEVATIDFKEFEIYLDASVIDVGIIKIQNSDETNVAILTKIDDCEYIYISKILPDKNIYLEFSESYNKKMKEYLKSKIVYTSGGMPGSEIL